MLRAVCCSMDKTVIQWDVDKGRALRIFQQHSAPVFAIQLLAERNHGETATHRCAIVLQRSALIGASKMDFPFCEHKSVRAARAGGFRLVAVSDVLRSWAGDTLGQQQYPV